MVLGYNYATSIQTGVEFVLYDFNDPATFYNNYIDLAHIVPIGNHLRKILHFTPAREYIIEGLGYVGDNPGMPLNYFYGITTGLNQVVNHLAYIVEDDEIVYKTMWYKEPWPSNYKYVPFVREGVKWVYCCKNPYWVEEFWGKEYYSFEMKSDVLIGDKYYKPVQLTRYVDENGSNKVVEDFTPVYLREEDKVVYAIIPDGILYPQCPVGCFSYIGFPYDDSPITTSDQEFMLYDFNDPSILYGSLAKYDGTSFVTVGDHQSKCHHYTWDYGDDEVIIEGIGYDGSAGMPLFFFEYSITGFQVSYYLSHVIENDEIIYKSNLYNPNVEPVIPGDANGDGEISIADANSVIDIVIMGGNASHPRMPAIDINDDGEVTIADVNAIIDIILKNNLIY